MVCRPVATSVLTAEPSYIASPPKSPLPYGGKVLSFESHPVVFSDSTPGSLLDVTNHNSPTQFVPDSQTGESVTRTALLLTDNH